MVLDHPAGAVHREAVPVREAWWIVQREMTCCFRMGAECCISVFPVVGDGVAGAGSKEAGEDSAEVKVEAAVHAGVADGADEEAAKMVAAGEAETEGESKAADRANKGEKVAARDPERFRNNSD